MSPRVRFDNHSPGKEHSFALCGLEGIIVARQLDEVLPALVEVEQAVADGRFAGGYVAYEAAPAFDRALTVRVPDTDAPFADLPLVWFGVYRSCEQLDPFHSRSGTPPYNVSAWRAEIDRTEYEAAVTEIRRRIAGGDTYQVNYTFRLRADFAGDPYEFYRDLVLAQRGAYAASIDLGRYHLLSASPESFFRMEDGQIVLCPMKGTTRRGRWADEDDELAQQLLESEKERAENLMIVDLVRSDIGRIASVGSVRVNELLALDRLETLWQLTSSIAADIAPDVRLVQVMQALFPPGSVTGAPKASTMEIISGLEQSSRGVYCGALGYLTPRDHGGIVNFAVGIRTVVIDTVERLAEYGVGGGVTWDSVAEKEFEEALLKAQLLVERRPDFELLETIRWDPDIGFTLLDEHFERIARSGLYFGFALNLELIKEGLDGAVAGRATPHRVRLVVRRDGAVSTTVASLDEDFHSDIQSAPILRVALCEEAVSSDDVFLFHKTTNRVVYDMRFAAHPSVDDVVLVNEHGEVTETTLGNIAVRFDCQWWTPPIESGCLGGTYRSRLIADGVLRERPISREELARAGDIAVLNSVRGWRRAVISH